MNSDEPTQSAWRTTDGNPWWLRSTGFTEPNGNYHANCYLDIRLTSILQCPLLELLLPAPPIPHSVTDPPNHVAINHPAAPEEKGTT
eukprot:gene57833-biopygen25316